MMVVMLFHSHASSALPANNSLQADGPDGPRPELKR
jgi:hypothetical protein